MRTYAIPKGWTTKEGYRRFIVKDRSRKFEHVLVWEACYGAIPPGMELHHINGNKLDNRLENLRLVTRLEHKRIHGGCLRVGDMWLKRCRRCRWMRPIQTHYYVYPGRNGVMGLCRRCATDLAVERKKKRRTAIRPMVSETAP